MAQVLSPYYCQEQLRVLVMEDRCVPASVRRIPPSFDIRLDKMRTPEWMVEPDPLFESLYLTT